MDEDVKCIQTGHKHMFLYNNKIAVNNKTEQSSLFCIMLLFKDNFHCIKHS